MSETAAAFDYVKPGLRGRALGSPVGRLASGWWIDRPALATVLRLFFPISRMWAAADLAEGDVQRFAAEVPMRIPRGMGGRVERALARVDGCRAAARETLNARDVAFWAPDAPPPPVLAALEAERFAASDRYMNSRLAFWPLRALGRPPAIRLALPSPDETFAAVADGLTDPAAWFAPRPGAVVERSHAISNGGARRDYWLRLRSPAPLIDDVYTVRVREPVDVADPPTVIYGSGVGMETDQWCDPLGDFGPFLARGLRVVELHAPWHGARRLPGRWSGEPFFATAPLGPVALFQSQVVEMAALIAWLRANTGGPIALAGVSLGALAAQALATNAWEWPETLRPDAMMLLTAADRMDLMTFDSAMARGLGMDKALTKAGWTREMLARLLPLGDPQRPPVMGADNVVMVLGTKDSITPYARGAAIARRWGVPDANLFVGRRGHFSTPVNTLRDQRPLDRLTELLRRL